MDYQLKDKVALVTGGSHGLGKAICLGLAAEGARVAVNYFKDEAKGIDFLEQAQSVVDEIKEKYGTDAITVPCDVAHEDQVEAMFAEVDAKLGTPYILVNNAAVAPVGWVREMDFAAWKSVIDINLHGTFLCARAFLQRRWEAGEGKIVNIASQAAFCGSNSGKAPYDSSKGAVVSFTKSLAREGAAKNILVNAVAPGLIYTEMIAPMVDADPEKFISRTPLKRLATPEQIASVVIYLASEESNYMTGTTVDATGGMMMR